MTGDWTAVAVRARGLSARRLGRAEARGLARSGSLAEAVGILSHTPYGRDVRPGMDLAPAEHAVFSTLLWHLRVLAGWAPSRGLDRVRLLAAGFEIANVVGHLPRASSEARAIRPPYALGALTTAWGTISRAASGEEVRRALATSAWGDPGGSEIPVVGAALQVAWARRVAFGVPEARSWARIFAGLILARMLAAGAPPAPGGGIDRNLRLLLGGRWEGATALGDLARTLPTAAHALAGGRAAGDLWRAGARAGSVSAERAGGIKDRRAGGRDRRRSSPTPVCLPPTWRTRAAPRWRPARRAADGGLGCRGVI